MEGGSLFNPGFLGGSFMWWVGQIADDSVWRDNNLTGKYENKDAPTGWGRRYKVRIIGLHDQGENEIPSDQLPWAQIMYPVTAGGGQASSGQTSNLRQGMMVFGFFLDGQDQQIPVIMGVMGNNSQTPLATTTGDSRVTAKIPGTLATSGHASGAVAKSEQTKDGPPDTGLTTTKPKTPQQSQQEALLAKLKREPEATGINPTVALKNSPPTYTDDLSQYIGAEQEAKEQAAMEAGFAAIEATVAERRRKRQEALQAKVNQANSPDTPPQPGATIEQVDAPHQLTAADVKLQEKIEEKISLMKPDPDNVVQSAMKSLQTVIETLTKKIDKYLSTINSYIDAVSNVITNIQSVINSAAYEASKYMKIMMDKVMEYMMKILNKAMAPVVAALPSSFRYLFSDLKEEIVELICCLYNKITEGLFSMLQGVLSSAFDLAGLEALARDPQTRGTERKNPKVPVCYAEGVVGQVLNGNSGALNDFNDGLLGNMNTFLGDINGQIAGVQGLLGGASGGGLGDMTNLLGSLTGNITSAMNFTNIKLNVFGCELEPQLAVSDFYQLATGGGGTPEQQLPSEKSVSDSVQTAAEPTPGGTPPYVQPTSNTPDVDLTTSSTTVDPSVTSSNDVGDRYQVDPETSEIKVTRPETPEEIQERQEAQDALDLY